MEKMTLIKIFFAAKIIACGFFIFDVAFDLRNHIISMTPYGNGEIIHLAFEILAVFALGSGIFVTSRFILLLREGQQSAELSLSLLRKDFDGLVRQKFVKWALTPAEKDISILLLKGLGTAEISEMRSTKLGTVKLQVHKILQKSGATNRAEFMSLFIDDFLDFEAEIPARRKSCMPWRCAERSLPRKRYS